jgi:two-component system response regulator FixJ
LALASVRNVYVVDDDDAVRDSLCALLQSVGFTVHDYPSARAFLAALPGRPCGCLVLDLHMPEMSGVELLEYLRNRGTLPPTIAMTGRSDPQLRDRVLRLGAIAFLDKPIVGDALTDALADVAHLSEYCSQNACKGVRP